MYNKKIMSYVLIAIATTFMVMWIATGSRAPSGHTVEAATDPGSGVFSYDGYGETLKKYVDDRGFVNYKGLKADRKQLDDFVASLGALSQAEYRSWSEADRIALWSNVYNAVTLKAIIDHYPIKKGSFINGLRFPENSIRQIDGVWDELTMRVMGKPYTLGEVEHEVLRAEFDEPRIHMAIVCASIGCPPLRNEPFVGDRLDEQLAGQARDFLASKSRFKIDRANGKVYWSPIFNWFGGDFVSKYSVQGGFSNHSKNNRAVLNFIAQHIDASEAEYLKNKRYTLSNLDYDWSLNEQ